MRRLASTTKDIETLARLMRAESLSEGGLGMYMVGGVAANRIIAACLQYNAITNVQQAVYQKPGGFTSVNSPIFNSRPNSFDKKIARDTLRGTRFEPATNSLFFYAPEPGEECRDEWFGAKFVGKFKSHCYYQPSPEDCPEFFN